MTSVGAPDLSAFFAEQSKVGTHCSVGVTLAKLDADRAALLRAALDEPSLQSAAIVRTLKKWGVDVARDSVGRHRNGVCRCGR